MLNSNTAKKFLKHFSSVQFSGSFVSDSLRPHESQHARPPCPSPTPGVHTDSRPSSRWCHPAISSSVVPFSNARKWKVKVKSLSRTQLLATPWTVAHQATGFSKQEYLSGLPFPTPGDLPNSGIEHVSLMSPYREWLIVIKMKVKTVVKLSFQL